MTEKTLKEKIKFRIQFMLMMWNCGRDEEANESLKLAMELIDQIEDYRSDDSTMAMEDAFYTQAQG